MEVTANVFNDVNAALGEADSTPPITDGKSPPAESPPAFLPDTKGPPGADAPQNPAQAEEDDSSTHWNL